MIASAEGTFCGPCSECEYRGANCRAYAALETELFNQTAYRVPVIPDAIDRSLDSFVEAWLSALRRVAAQSPTPEKTMGEGLSCAFDLAATGLYVNALIDSNGLALQEALVCGDKAVFPFTWMCPLCVAAGKGRRDCYLPSARREPVPGSGRLFRDFPLVEKLAKPRARAIGDAGYKIIKSLVRTILRLSGKQTHFREGGGRRGEFDFTLTSKENLAFVEVKAKPLVCYPLVAELDSPPKTTHQWERVGNLDLFRLALFCGAHRFYLPLNHDFGETWPLPSLTTAISEVGMCEMVLANWQSHLEAYRKWKGEPDQLRWHRFGCGNFSDDEEGNRVEKRVANTKELPGLDRTDDIKKGSAQLLIFGRFKFDCLKDRLRTMLIGNLWGETHGLDYLDPISHLRVSRSGANESDHRWLVDSIIGFSNNHVNDATIRHLFDPMGLLESKKV